MLGPRILALNTSVGRIAGCAPRSMPRQRGRSVSLTTSGGVGVCHWLNGVLWANQQMPAPAKRRVQPCVVTAVWHVNCRWPTMMQIGGCFACRHGVGSRATWAQRVGLRAVYPALPRPFLPIAYSTTVPGCFHETSSTPFVFTV